MPTKINLKISLKQIFFYFYIFYIILFAVTIIQLGLFFKKKVYEVIISDGKTLMAQNNYKYTMQNNININNFEKIIKNIEQKTAKPEYKNFKNIFK